jgi:hypothetical protein
MSVRPVPSVGTGNTDAEREAVATDGIPTTGWKNPPRES